MRALSLDYQRTLPGRHRPGFAVLAAGLALCALLAAQSFSLVDELAATEQQVVKLRRDAERRRPPAGGERAVAEATPGEATPGEARPPSPSAARWEALLGSLEKAGDDSVTLLGLEPGARDISITGEARNIAASLDYAQRLQQAPVFAEVHPVKHEVVGEHPYRPVRFTLSARWREAP